MLLLDGSAECLLCQYVRPVTNFEEKHCPSCGRAQDEWKLGAAARGLTAQANARGK